MLDKMAENDIEEVAEGDWRHQAINAQSNRDWSPKKNSEEWEVRCGSAFIKENGNYTQKCKSVLRKKK